MESNEIDAEGPKPTPEPPRDSIADFERALAETNARDATFVLRLYVVGMTPRSLRAITNARALCAEILPGRHDLQVIDLNQQPHLAKGEQIVAAPTLIRRFPPPTRRVVGDLSDRAGVLAGLGLQIEAIRPDEEDGR